MPTYIHTDTDKEIGTGRSRETYAQTENQRRREEERGKIKEIKI